MSEDTHKPVLIDSVLDLLKPALDHHYLDLTAGYGGHAAVVLRKLGNKGRMTLVDRDRNAIKFLKNRFKDEKRVTILHQDYLSASEELVSRRQTFDSILADIGMSSPHLDNPDRGFSFMNDGPLDMRMDNRIQKTAADIVNMSSEEELADLLYQYGELRSSRSLARTIIQNRPYQTTHDLASVIHGAYNRRMRIRAQVFQALRIVVNDELNQLRSSLPLWHMLLKPEGKLAVITFHSLEDRIVKQYFQEHGANVFGSELAILSKRPIVATPDEIAFNPRARSAKLRVAQRK